MTTICDHTSVGILVWRSGNLLLVERRRKPFGFAPPAGHVDDGPSFEEAARKELFEEVGLKARSLAPIFSAAQNNPCRRQGGTWHYWRIYEADAHGELKRSAEETKDAKWVDLATLIELRQRGLDYVQGKISESDWELHPGLEPVWCDILTQLGILPGVSGVTSSDLDWARNYSWNWFSYHAGQRMNVFQFYLVAFAFLFAGYSTLAINKLYPQAVGVGILQIAVTYLFWRLDLRNHQLVKISEIFLKAEEAQVASRLRRPEIRIAEASETKWRKWPFTFREIYKLLFGLVAVSCVIMIAWASYHWWEPSKPGDDVQKSVQRCP